MTVKLLTEQHLEFLSLSGGCTGSSQSTFVKMLHCLKSHVMADIQSRLMKTDLQLRVHNYRDVFLFLNQKICCVYSKEPYLSRDVTIHRTINISQ